MAAIDFIPDRLNVRPVVWRGFTVGELGVAALCGAGLKAHGCTELEAAFMVARELDRRRGTGAVNET
ncbi:DUF3487 family protein [Salmonella enterica]|nr:DUF3487 family protein [Salmonella enterica]EJJ4081633.1 DUF3487 family protein [Salmonella enterica]